VITSTVLLTYAVIVGVVGGRHLATAHWPERSPRLGIWAWQALTASIVLASGLAGATLAVPTLPASTSLATLLEACQHAIREQYSTPGGAVTASVGALFTLTIAGRLAFAVTLTCIATTKRRNQQRRSLLLVADRHGLTGVHVVPHTAPAVYCLPGRPSLIVLTSSALSTLDNHQLKAVLAHERAHLRNRDHRVLTAAAVLLKAFPFIPVFKAAQMHMVRLVEMDADDVASKHHDRRVLAKALVRLAEGAIPAAAIGASGGAALTRVKRLVGPPDPISWPCSMLVAVAALAMLILPMVTTIVAAVLDYCALGFPLLQQ
jgi:Zn-dependent protease with chaperone function